MSTHTTTAGKVKVSLALSPGAYQLLKEMSPGPRAVGALLDDLVYAEAARRSRPPEPPARGEGAPDPALLRRLVELQERERRALSRDLHDTSGQSITALKLGLGSLKRAGECSESLRARIDELLALADTVSEDLHRLAVNLRPSSLDRYGLIPALEQLLAEFEKQSGVETQFAVMGPFERLSGDIETALYRIVQESLTNIARYARARLVSVMLQRRDDEVQVIVEDNGLGFDVDEALGRGRLGLQGMRERAEMLGGRLEIESAAGRGTGIYASVPARAGEAPAPAGTTPLGDDNDLLAAPAQPAYPPRAEARVGAGPAETWPAGEHGEAPGARPAEAAELARGKALSDALVDITQAAARCPNADEVLRLVLARSAEAIGRDNAHIAVRAGDAWEVRYAYRDAMPGRQMAELDAPAFEWVERTRQVLVVNDTSAAETPDALRLEKRHVKSYACMPLLAGDRLLGVLSFVNYAVAAAFHPSEVEFLNRLTALAALAVENARLNEAESRQRAELAQRVEELERLLEVLPVGVAIAYDPDAHIIRVNPALARLLSVGPDTNVSLDTGPLPREADYRVLCEGRELRAEELPMQRAARGEVVRGLIVDTVRADGAAFTQLASAVPLLDAEGRPRGAVGAWVNITELRRAEAAAEEASRTLETLLEYIPEGITIADAPDARIRRVSRYGQELLGAPHADLTAGEVAGQWAVYDADCAVRLADEDLPLVRALRSGEIVRDLEVVQINAQGRALPLLCNAGPIRDREGRITGAVVAWRDITAVKAAHAQTEAALAALSEREATLRVAHAAVTQAYDAASQSEERYRSLFNGMTEGFALHEIVTGDSGAAIDYRFLAINPAFERLTGLKRGDVEGRLKSEVLPGDDPVWLELYGRVALTGEPVHFENRSTALARWYDVYAYSPAPRQFAVIFTEITARKQAEERAERQQAIQEGVNQILEAALTCETEEAVGRAALAVCERITGSKFGFVGELNPQGGLDCIAISDPGWEQCRMEEAAAGGAAASRSSLTFLVHGIYGRVLIDGKGFFTNDPSSHPDRIGTPSGHPPLTAFLGVPLLRRGEPAGMVGLGNREGGYRSGDQEAAEALGVVIIEALDRKRAEERIRRLNADLAQANEQLQEQAAALTETAAMLREATEGLERRVRARTDELAAANVRLMEANWAAAESEAALQNLSRRLVEMQENERFQVANELYNDEGQRLAALIIELGRLQKGGMCAPAVEAQIEKMIDLTDGVLADMHRLAVNLRPAALDRLGLGAALREALGRFGLDAGVRVQAELTDLDGLKLPAQVETNTYRIVQEALSNTARHAHAARVAVTAIRRGDKAGNELVVIIVEDDGAGFDVEAAQQARSLGLLAMRERAEAMGGSVALESAAGQGTTVYIEVPID